MTGIEVSNLIRSEIKQDLKELDNLINQAVENWAYNSSTEFRILVILKRIESKVTAILEVAIFQAYESKRKLEFKKANRTPAPIDIKAVQTLVKDSVGDFHRGVENGRKFVGAFFRTAKADIINEYDISQTVLNDMLEGGTLKTSIKSLEEEYRLRGSTIQTKIIPYSKEDIAEKLNDFEKKVTNGMAPGRINKGIVKALRKKMEKSFQDKQIIQIINKNGDPMHFDLEYYSRLVARTRVARASIEGTISYGEQFGKYVLYRVSDHNTSTPKCEKFEGKYLSRDPELIGGTFKGIPILKMDEESTPIYHPNCKHGLTVVAITRNEYLQISKKVA